MCFINKHFSINIFAHSSHQNIRASIELYWQNWVSCWALPPSGILDRNAKANLSVMLGITTIRESQQKCTHKTILALMNAYFLMMVSNVFLLLTFFSHSSQQNMKALTETCWQIWVTMLGTITIRDSKQKCKGKTG